ncbi:MAG: hypothetical protein ABWZ99_13890 [Ilumatobacteraceae bacterium]
MESANGAATGSAVTWRGRRGRRRALVALTTPAGLRTATAALVLAIVVFGAFAIGAARHRQDAADTVGLDATPLVVGAEELYPARADADATGSTAFLAAGAEPPALHARYLDDVDRAGRLLVDIAAQDRLSPDARDAVAELAAQLPRYARLVEAARTNSRLDNPVGAAYLRRASDLMTDEMLPTASGIYEEAAHRLDRGYRAGTSGAPIIGVLAAAALALALLVAVQSFVARRTRRIVNLGLLGATALVVALLGWAVTSFSAQQQALTRSERDGSDLLLALSTMRILALRSLSDENLHLIERGTVSSYRDDFADVTASISGPLMERARRSAPDEATRTEIGRIEGHHRNFVSVHDRIARLFGDDDEYAAAVDVAVTDLAAAAATVDEALGTEITAARTRLDDGADDARQRLRTLPVVLLIGIAAAIAAAVVGLQLRLREYR